MIKQIVGGAIMLVIGGTTFAVSKTNITKNFSSNTGMSQQQAQQYINNIPKSNMGSFSSIGSSLVSDGNSALSQLSNIDCNNYTYQWQTPSLSCSDGLSQMQSLGNDEVTLGNCYQALGSDLGTNASNKINECINDGDTLNSDYTLPIAAALIDSKTITDTQNSIAYNKSVLQAALQSNKN